ncbi:MAG: alpha/beta hydrolase [Verrucomicrobiaceae bacterium]|nr:alpha/beta hydrolase [Verrucomicrobiaceae bacterium]
MRLCLPLFIVTVISHAADLSGVKIQPVSYLPEGRKERADMYLPEQFPDGKKLPAVLIIHGGGFTGGKRNAERELNIGSNLVRAGYVAMSIDYLLATPEKPSWPQNIHDCKTAVRWLRANADTYHIDSDHIGVIGGSAGGTLAALVTLCGPDAGLDPSEPFGTFSCQVQCGIDLYGPSDFTIRTKSSTMFGKSFEEAPALYKQASPVFQATKGDPPLMIMHGTADKTVDLDQSRLMAAACEKAGIEHELVIIEGAPHTFHMQPKQKDLRPVMIGFFNKHLKVAGK